MKGWEQQTLTAEELRDFEAFLSDKEHRELFAEAGLEVFGTTQPLPAFNDRLLPMLERSLDIDRPEATGQKNLPASSENRIHFLKTAWFRYAAILLLVAGVAGLLYLNDRPQQKIVQKQPVIHQDVAPGGNKAILTLSDGSSITLDSAAIGNLAQQGDANIIKLNSGSLAYIAGKGISEKILYNTISTPKGGQYRIVLPDGSGVWLNAASSITFPTAFVKDRKVVITGEAYFEVLKDETKPFMVSANGTDVEVLGTSFNVNAYNDETSVKTSLAEGSVKVTKDGKAAVLKPGQQCATINGDLLVAVNADIEQALAWKNGTFFFKRTNIADAMRQISRWYDVEVVYEKGVPDIKLGGEMKRDLTLSQMLEALGELGVQFHIENKRLTVINDSSVK